LKRRKRLSKEPRRGICSAKQRDGCQAVVSKRWFLALVATGCMLGCGMNAETTREAPEKAPPVDVAVKAPPVGVAAGKVDPSLVGVWVNPGETYKLKSDGSFTMHFDRMERSGPGKGTVRKTGDLSGKWSVADGALLLDVLSGKQVSNHTLNLVMHEAGAVMELRPTFMKKGTGTLYKRSK